MLWPDDDENVDINDTSVVYQTVDEPLVDVDPLEDVEPVPIADIVPVVDIEPVADIEPVEQEPVADIETIVRNFHELSSEVTELKGLTDEVRRLAHLEAERLGLNHRTNRTSHVLTLSKVGAIVGTPKKYKEVRRSLIITAKYVIPDSASVSEVINEEEEDKPKKPKEKKKTKKQAKVDEEEPKEVVQEKRYNLRNKK